MENDKFLALMTLLTQVKTEQRSLFLSIIAALVSKSEFERVKEASLKGFAESDKALNDILGNLDVDVEE